jgi:rhamnose utilization protein RhaD (predicted bifunctional aldolase and dehydrogenase)
VARISQRGPATPDHVIRTKPVPMLGRDVAGFGAGYRRYFEANAKQAKESKTVLDAAPRMALDSELGLAAFGAPRRHAIVEDLEHTVSHPRAEAGHGKRWRRHIFDISTGTSGETRKQARRHLSARSPR